LANSGIDTRAMQVLDDDSPTTRRDFLMLAGMGAAAASLVTPSKLFAAADAVKPGKILVPANAHPAMMSAAKILAKKLDLDESVIATYDGAPHATPGAIVLALAKDGKLAAAEMPKVDGYTVTYAGGTVVWGARPRSVLYAAGEPHHWVGSGNRDQGTGNKMTYRRSPEFALRNATWHPDYPVAEQAAIFGANFFIANLRSEPTLEAVPEVYAALGAAERKSLLEGAAMHKLRNAATVKEFHDADVEVYALLPYGNNFATWSPALYAATVKTYPTAKGVPMANSHESAALCPSDAQGWRVLEAYVKEYSEQCGADGISATFWDNYSAFCQDARCKANGMDKFPNEVHEFLSRYHALLTPMGQKLHMRTWSSGSPHWLGTNYVHAPGYGQFGLTHPELWARVIKETPADLMMQTKIYHSDCEPNSRFTTLLGKCKPHVEMVEYQQVGQFIGRQYFPAATVNYTAATMKKALELVGAHGGVQMHAGGTSQPEGFDLLSDILNSNCIYAWRELTWNINVDLAAMWHEWATQIYGAAAALAMVRFMRASEDACTWCWSPLGHGSSTNADFAGSIARREVLLRYTNRYYLPEFAAHLEPTLENVTKMEKQKSDCMAKIAEMKAALDVARPHLTEAQAAEVTTRFEWFRHFAICNTTLDVSLWRFRYLRGLAGKLTTDPKQMQELAAAYDLIEIEAPKLFQFDKTQKLSMYRVPLGELQRPPALGNPRSLMHDIYTQSLRLVLESVGVNYLPQEWMRGTMPTMDVPANQLNPQGRRGAAAPPAEPAT
jgi:hypothetical protein